MPPTHGQRQSISRKYSLKNTAKNLLYKSIHTVITCNFSFHVNIRIIEIQVALNITMCTCVQVYGMYLYLYSSLLGHCLVLSLKLYIDIQVIHWTLKNKDDTILEQIISVPAKNSPALNTCIHRNPLPKLTGDKNLYFHIIFETFNACIEI